MADPMGTDATKDKRHRSPAYPFISLPKAIERAQAFYDREKRHPAPVGSALKAWKFAEKSSGGQQTVAALKQYGLMVDDGSGANRRVKLTDRAFGILLDEVKDSPDRAKAIREAALSPKLFAEMAARWDGDLPSDDTIRTFLRRDKGFNDDVLSAVIRAFKETLAFANVGKYDKIDDEQDDQIDKPAVGDFVQWESQGAFQFTVPKRLVGFSDDGAYAFIEGETTGVPMEQLTKVEPPKVPPPAPPPGFGSQVKSQPGVSREVFSIDGGEAVLQWPDAIDKASVQELDEWLKLVIRKLKRRAGVTEGDGPKV